MLRPLSKTTMTTLSSPASPLFCDANAFADVLGVSPAYKQKETFRWNTAMQMYQEMSNQDLTSAATLDNNFREKAPADSSTTSGAKSPSSCCSPRKLPLTRRATTLAGLSLGQHSADGCVSDVVNHVYSSPTSRAWISPAPYEGNFTGASNGCLQPPKIGNLCRSLSAQDARHMQDIYSKDLTALMNVNESSLNALELEIIAAVHELQFAVRDVFVSELLPRTGDLIFLNITTSEGQPFCIELTNKGWRVSSLRHDCMNGDIAHIDLHTRYFETIYSLMDAISERYRQRFSKALSEKLSLLQEKSTDKAHVNHAEESTGQSVENVNSPCRPVAVGARS